MDGLHFAKMQVWNPLDGPVSKVLVIGRDDVINDISGDWNIAENEIEKRIKQYFCLDVE